MIIKVIDHKQRQTEADAEALVKYVKGLRDMEDREKLAAGFGGEVHFETADAGRQILLLKELMRETASRRPILHAVVSWDEGVRPSPQQVREATEIWLREARLQGLPALWEAHENTGFFHAHIIVCLVEPESGEYRSPGMIKLASQRAKAKIEARQGLQACQEDMFVPAPDGSGRIVPNPKRGKNRKKAEAVPDAPELPPLRQGVAAMAQRTGVQSAQSKAQETVPRLLEAADGWQDFHSLLANESMTLRPAPKGGYIFTVDGVAVKASSVMRKCGKKLEEKFGPYEPPVADVPAPAPAPEVPAPAAGMDADLLPFWQRYLAEESAWKEDSRRAAKAAREAWKARTKAVVEANRAVRRQVRAETRLAEKLVKKARRTKGWHSLPSGTEAALRLALEERSRSRLVPVPAQGRSGRPVWPSFAAWLEAVGEPALAERWRHRGSVSPQPASEPEEDGPRPGL